MVAINITPEAFNLLEEAHNKMGINKKFLASKIIIENIGKYLKK